MYDNLKIEVIPGKLLTKEKKEKIKYKTTKNHLVFLATNSNQVLGHLIYSIKSGHIIDIFVEDGHRNKSIGTKLVHKMIDISPGAISEYCPFLEKIAYSKEADGLMHIDVDKYYHRAGISGQ